MILATAPSGARFPLRIWIWPVALIGSLNGRTIVCPAVNPGKRRQILGQRLAGDGQAIAVQQSFRQQVLHHRRRAADGVQILLHELSARLQVGQKGNAIADR